MDDKVKQIYKENLTYSLYGIIVIFVFQIVFMNEGSLFYDEDGKDVFFLIGQYRTVLCILFLGGLRGFYLTQKLKK